MVCSSILIPVRPSLSLLYSLSIIRLQVEATRYQGFYRGLWQQKWYQRDGAVAFEFDQNLWGMECASNTRNRDRKHAKWSSSSENTPVYVYVHVVCGFISFVSVNNLQRNLRTQITLCSFEWGSANHIKRLLRVHGDSERAWMHWCYMSRLGNKGDNRSICFQMVYLLISSWSLSLLSKPTDSWRFCVTQGSYFVGGLFCGASAAHSVGGRDRDEIGNIKQQSQSGVGQLSQLPFSSISFGALLSEMTFQSSCLFVDMERMKKKDVTELLMDWNIRNDAVIWWNEMIIRLQTYPSKSLWVCFSNIAHFFHIVLVYFRDSNSQT